MTLKELLLVLGLIISGGGLFIGMIFYKQRRYIAALIAVLIMEIGMLMLVGILTFALWSTLFGPRDSSDLVLVLISGFWLFLIFEMATSRWFPLFDIVKKIKNNADQARSERR